MKKICVALLLVSALHVQLSARNVSGALDSMLQRTLDSMLTVVNIKSLSAAIQLSDSNAWAKASGISSLAPAVPATPEYAYLIGSVAKTITSACILQLADEQKLSLDDSLHKWLDTFQYVDPNITIRQLLRHQSGLSDVLANPAHQPALLARMDSIWSADNLIRNFLMPPLNQPGAAWNYCNTNYMLLSIIIKKVSGHPFYEEIRNRFFRPLGMNTIAIPAFETLSAPVAHVWMDLDGDGVTEDADGFYMSWMSLNSAAGACGGYFATAGDLSKWMRTYMRGNLLSAGMMAEAKTTVFATGSQGGLYGLGLMKNSMAGYLAYGHGGDLSYAASSWYFPAKDISISVCGNDAKVNSWQLLRVVEALLKTYNGWQATTAVPALPDNLLLTTYPSPFSGRLTVAVQHDQSLKDITGVLVNMTGERIVTAAAKHAGNVTKIEFDDLSGLPKGLYSVKIYADNRFLKSVKVIR